MTIVLESCDSMARAILGSTSFSYIVRLDACADRLGYLSCVELHERGLMEKWRIHWSFQNAKMICQTNNLREIISSKEDKLFLFNRYITKYCTSTWRINLEYLSNFFGGLIFECTENIFPDEQDLRIYLFLFARVVFQTNLSPMVHRGQLELFLYKVSLCIINFINMTLSLARSMPISFIIIFYKNWYKSPPHVIWSMIMKTQNVKDTDFFIVFVLGFLQIFFAI